MKTPRALLLWSLASMAAACCVAPALAQENHHHRFTLTLPRPAAESSAVTPSSEATPRKRLVALQAGMLQAFPTVGANSDGSDVWPCIGRNTPNPDCPSVGNPAVPLPLGGMVIGVPAYTWALQNNDIIGFGLGNGVGCDALTNGTTGSGASGTLYRPCGQISTWFEDDTFDSTDDLLWHVVVKQGDDIVYDTGIVDFGPAGPIAYPVDVLLANDTNFGFWPGSASGPNNGNCSPDIGYPLAAPSFPGVPYTVESRTTCHQPVAGPAIATMTTVLATPSYTKETGTACTSRGVPSPCFTAHFERQHEMHQEFALFLE